MFCYTVITVTISLDHSALVFFKLTAIWKVGLLQKFDFEKSDTNGPAFQF